MRAYIVLALSFILMALGIVFAGDVSGGAILSVGGLYSSGELDNNPRTAHTDVEP